MKFYTPCSAFADTYFFFNFNSHIFYTKKHKSVNKNFWLISDLFSDFDTLYSIIIFIGNSEGSYN